mmetsp:Transcript_23795/g.70104  ORF Transcript_23795/g.70104 Transcript_23795/m.70104 type:complete len:311 (-) Transcript_23795:304-1236(-)
MGGAGTSTMLSRWRGTHGASKIEVKEAVHWPLSSPPGQEKRCALLLYGLPKFFKDRSYPTLEARLLSRLPFPCDVFVHTYNLHETTNVRNNEAACRIYPEEVEVAQPVRVEMEDQSVVDKVLYNEFLELKRYGDAWFNHYVSLRNVLRQYNSIQQVYKLMEKEQEERGFEYSIVCCSRMDVLYLDNLPDDCIQALHNIEPGTIWVPNFHEWELRSDNLIYPTGGMNDRFAIGCRHAMRVYTQRIASAVQFCRQKYRMFHTETFLKWHLAQHRVAVRKMRFRFQRIRGTGEIHDIDRELDSDKADPASRRR